MKTNAEEEMTKKERTDIPEEEEAQVMVEEEAQVIIEEGVTRAGDETSNPTETTDKEVTTRTGEGTGQGTTAGSIKNASIEDATTKTIEGTKRESPIVLLTNKRRFHPHHRLNRKTSQKAPVSTNILETSPHSLQTTEGNP